MIYSVYDYPSGKYEYYEAPASLPAAGWFREPVGGLPVPESIAAPLPASAKYVGSGTQARGVIAAKPQGMLKGFSFRRAPGWLKFASVFGLAFFLGRKSRK